MEHNGYEASVTFDNEAGIFHGELVGIRDVVTFQGESVEELRQAFRESVDDYVSFCRERGREPEIPFTGHIPVKISPEAHRAAAEAAKYEGKTLETWLSEIIERAAAGTT